MAIPDTNTFTLQDVVDEITLQGVNTLVQCFDASDPNYFNSDYTPIGFDPKASDKSGYKLSYFRDYGSHNYYYIEVDPDSARVSGSPGTVQTDVNINPDGESWSASADVSWITSISPSDSYSGDFNGVYIDYGTNYTGSVRYGVVTFTMDNYSDQASITIQQEA